MSTTRETTVWCDAERSDGGACQVWLQVSGTAKDARECGRARRWKRHKGLDLCPDHTEWRP